MMNSFITPAMFSSSQQYSNVTITRHTVDSNMIVF